MDELWHGLQILFWVSLPVSIPILVGIIVAIVWKVLKVLVGLICDVGHKEEPTSRRGRGHE